MLRRPLSELTLAFGLFAALLLGASLAWSQESGDAKPKDAAAAEKKADAGKPKAKKAEGEKAEDADAPSRAPAAITIDDAETWSRMRGTRLSKDGQWFGYVVGPTPGDGEAVIRRTDADEDAHRMEIGDGGSFSFSEDSKWVAFTVAPKKKEAERARKMKKPVERKAVVMKLGDEDTKAEIKNVSSFAFNGERCTWIAVRRAGTTGKGKGGDLILHELATGKRLNIGNVSSFAFDKSGEWLAWCVDAADKSGNGVQLRNMDSGVVLPLASGEATFSKLGWTKEGDALAFLEGSEHDDYEKPLQKIHGFRDFAKGSPTGVTFDPADVKIFPKDMTVSPNRSPSWTEDRQAILFGIHDAEKKEKDKKDAKKSGGDAKSNGGGSSDKPDLVIWHHKDKRLQSQQQVEASRDKRRSFLCAWRIEDDTFLRIGDDEVRDYQPAPKGKFAIAVDRTPYRRQAALDGKRFSDVYVADLATGKKRLAVKKCRWYNGPSPDGTRILYYQDSNYHVLEMATGETYNITEGVPTSFVDVEDDHNVENPPVRPIGWVKGGASVLLSDAWDIWHIPAHGGQSVNLTVNGKAERLRYNRRYRLDPDEEGIDLSGAMYVNVFGEDTKRNAIGRIDGGRPGVTIDLGEGPSYGSLRKAEDADVYVYTLQSATHPAEHYASKGKVAEGRKLTNAAAHEKDFLWSDGAQIVRYESKSGKPLTAALYRPAGYIEGKSYPTVVYIYETLSQRMHSHDTPRIGGFSQALYTSQGYAVLMPDITYRINDPGMSAVECVLPALEAAIATTVVDPEKVGIHGHSWGGYQTAFLITQTDAFAAAVAGAPLTNMISMYSSIYWNSGSANQPIFESSQGRFTGGYWENIEAYTRNSPVYYADKVTTPLLLLHNDKDGAVDWNQGIEYFNTLRRLEKPVVMLQYVGENHGLRKHANRKDYSERMLEFFDHYLRGKDAPEWLDEGIPHLEHEDHIDERTAKAADDED